MARRPDPPDDDDELPPTRSTRRVREEVIAVADEGQATEEPADADQATADPAPRRATTPSEKPLTEQSDRKLLKKLIAYTEEFHLLAGDGSQVAMMRRVELTRLMRAVQTVRDAREELVEVMVPRSVTGEPFTLGPKVFHPGPHVVRASVAQYLLWLIGENQRVEMNRLKSNGRTIDLGTIGSRARMARISRDDGSTSDWGR